MSEEFDLDRLAEELEPVKPLNANGAIGSMVLLTVIGAVFVVSTLGFRDQFLGSTATDPMFLIRSGLLVVLAAASLSAATSMARPAVGTNRSGWRWAAMAALIVPIAAAVAALVSRTPVAERLHPVNGVECLTYSISIGLVLGAVLTWWLRRGAPTSPERAGTVTGLAAGSLGALAYSMHCPHNDLVYIGLWYTIAIGVTTLVGRLFVPRLVRW
ncbi:DUF1109 domain-containing protein [Parasphingopyxis sp. CP4]|uniref:NrsF family protein n=1 Tax=Parasphingopyxis sp. CP4 TaxID=2724527 RepID=UPI0015A38FF0|nr:DUF1109 domain-containing protein [Parasphingopyxis sp. CP4]QLC22183.1 DUF1109 domain-containing protein [Parasphingopyxis sp. CP4]